MTVYRCDRCGKTQILQLHQIKLFGGYLNEELPVRRCDLLFKDGYGGTNVLEVCTDCAKEIGDKIGFTVGVM